MHFIHYLDITFSIVLFYVVKGVNDNINGSEHSGVLELVFFYCIMTREVTESKAFTPRGSPKETRFMSQRYIMFFKHIYQILNR